MHDETVPGSNSIPAAEAALLAGAERRIARAMWVLGVVGMMLCWLWRDWRWASGFAVGAALSALNFHWMKTAVHAVADAASSPAAPARPRRGVVARFVLRYALIGLAGYVIFKSSFVSLGAFFLGLFLSLAAILVEVTCQIYGGFRNT